MNHFVCCFYYPLQYVFVCLSPCSRVELKRFCEIHENVCRPSKQGITGMEKKKAHTHSPALSHTHLHFHTLTCTLHFHTLTCTFTHSPALSHTHLLASLKHSVVDSAETKACTLAQMCHSPTHTRHVHTLILVLGWVIACQGHSLAGSTFP